MREFQVWLVADSGTEDNAEMIKSAIALCQYYDRKWVSECGCEAELTYILESDRGIADVIESIDCVGINRLGVQLTIAWDPIPATTK